MVVPRINALLEGAQKLVHIYLARYWPGTLGLDGRVHSEWCATSHAHGSGVCCWLQGGAMCCTSTATQTPVHLH
eukprot:scaffold20657_cov30-Tisochrysis_lutea.AAC.1